MKWRALLFLIIFTSAVKASGIKESLTPGVYSFSSKSFHAVVSKDRITLFYKLSRHDFKKISISFDQASVKPGAVIDHVRFLSSDGIKERAVYDKMTIESSLFSIEASEKGFRFDNSSVAIWRVEGASALVIQEGRLYFLQDDVLYPFDLISSTSIPDPLVLSMMFDLPVVSRTERNQLWSTFSGGSAGDQVLSVASAGSLVYACGSTFSTDFPATSGSYQDTLGGYYDAFISCYTREGQLKWSTYFGGSNLDVANKVVTDSFGNCYIGGHTSSLNFPVIGSPWQNTIKGSYESFILKFDSIGTPLYSGFFGGTGGDFLYGLGCDRSGNIFFGGGTTSQDLPTTVTSAQQFHAGAVDAYVAKFNSSLQLVWCSYLGGTGSEDLHSLTTDQDGNVVFCGGTYSTDLLTLNAFQLNHAGGSDDYITSMTSTGQLVFSTYYGGSSNEDAFGICTDDLGSIYFTGTTTSNDFPVGSPALMNYQGGVDAYLVKLSQAGSFLRGTFYGGSSDDQGADCSFGDGVILIAGSTFSFDLPVGTIAMQPTSGGSYDSFFAVLDTSFGFVEGSYFGGTGQETTYAIDHDTIHSFYIAGVTTGSDLPLSAFGAQTNTNGSDEGFIARLDYFNDPLRSWQPSISACIKVYPNPCADILHIESDIKEPRYNTLFTIEGKMILSTMEEEICIKDLQRGVYILKTRAGSDANTFKVIKD
jgi:hypothetical protein